MRFAKITTYYFFINKNDQKTTNTSENTIAYTATLYDAGLPTNSKNTTSKLTVNYKIKNGNKVKVKK